MEKPEAGLELELLLALFDCLPRLADAERVVSWGNSEMAYLQNVKQLIGRLLSVLFTAHTTVICSQHYSIMW